MALSRLPTAPEGAYDRYHAFLSYSHADGAVAKGVQRALQSIGRRVGRPSALRVFRDDTDLSAAPDLWGRVRQAMDASVHLIVVLSPNAAASEWVDREVDHWLDTRGAECLLFVLAAGTASYDEVAQRFDPVSDAVPPALIRPGVLVTEPVYVDVRDDVPWDAAAPGFRDRVMSLAAEIQGRPKSELAGDDLREQNRFNRWRRSVMGAFSVLTVVSLVLALVAINRSTEATRQRDEAVGLALAAAAEELVGVNDPLAVALASEAMAATETPRWQAVKALVSGRLSLSGRRGLRIGASITRHKGALVGVALSPDGTLLASIEGNGTVHLGDLTTKKEVATTFVHEDGANTLAFSPDGEILATAGYDTGWIRLWDPASGRLLREIQTGNGASDLLTFSPDGATLAAQGFDGVRLWDTRSGDPVGRPLIGGVSYSLAFSPDGTRLAVGQEGSISVWNPATGKVVRQLVLPEETTSGGGQLVVALAFRANGRELVSVSGDSVVRSWDPTSGRLTKHFRDLLFGFDGYNAVLSANGGFVATDAGLWETASGTRIQNWPGGSAVAAVAFNLESTRLAVLDGASGGIQLFDLDAGKAAIETQTSGNASIWSMAMRPNGGAIGVVRDGTASLVDPITWQTTRELIKPGTFRATHIDISADGTVAIAGYLVQAAGSDKVKYEVRLAAPDSGQQPAIVGTDADVSSIAFSPDGGQLAVGARVVSLFEVGTGRLLREIDACPDDGGGRPDMNVAFHPAGQTLAVSCSEAMSGGKIRVWSVVTGDAHGDSLDSTWAYVTQIAFSPDGSLLAASSMDNTVRLWNPDSGQPVGDPLVGHGEDSDHMRGVETLAFHPSGRLLASGGEDGTVRLWDTSSRQPVGVLPAPGVTQVLFSPDGHTLIASMADQSGEATGEVRRWTGLWEQDEGCAIAARYVDRVQLDPYLPTGWTTACPYVGSR